MPETTNRSMLLRILAFAALAGMRSISPLALLSLVLGRRVQAHQPIAAHYLGSIPGRAITTTMALGELVGDTLPAAPDRTFAPALAFRALNGAVVGATLASLTARPILLDGIGGAVTATASTFLTLRARIWLARSLPVPNAPIVAGLIEDAVLWLGGWWLLRGIMQHADANE